MLSFLLSFAHYYIMLVAVVAVASFVLSPFSVPAKNTANKMGLFFYGFIAMVLSTDKSWNKKNVPVPVLDEMAPSKRIIFLRHGESEWNLIFNRGVVKLLPRLIAAWVREVVMLVTCDSVFFDSPLNEEGIKQAKELAEILAKAPTDQKTAADFNALRGTEGNSLLVSSTLRRAIATMVAALWEPRLKKSGEKVLLLSACQEISRNVDTIALAEASGLPDMGTLEKSLSGYESGKTLDARFNYGTKPIFGTGLDRMQSFVTWAMNRPESTIIVGGHSLWFRFFFQTYLPADANPMSAKDFKMKNTGVVAFDLHGTETKGYCINPTSLSVVHLGFDDKKKSK